jgi:hypothetical protein
MGLVPPLRMEPVPQRSTRARAVGVPLEIKGGVSRSSRNDVPHLLFVTPHLPQVLADPNPRNTDAADKMESQDNINP